MLIAISTIEEIKENVFSINPNSASGLDGMSALFYQNSWPIISKDMHEAVMAFFEGVTMTKFLPYLSNYVTKSRFPPTFIKAKTYRHV